MKTPLPQQRKNHENMEMIAIFINLTHYPEGWGGATVAQSWPPVSMSSMVKKERRYTSTLPYACMTYTGANYRKRFIASLFGGVSDVHRAVSMEISLLRGSRFDWQFMTDVSKDLLPPSLASKKFKSVNIYRLTWYHIPEHLNCRVSLTSKT